MLNRTAALAVAALGLITSVAPAALIVQDSFSAVAGTPLIGRTPDVANVPGGTYVPKGDPGWGQQINGGEAQLGADLGMGISISSTGGYVKPSLIQISATFNVNNTTQDSFPSRVADLGFYSDNSAGGHGTDTLTALAVGRDGTLTVFQNNSGGATAAYTGFFDTARDHKLSYIINTADGSVSSVFIDGQLKSLSTNVFTDAATAFAGFAVSSSSGGPTGFFDNFTVTSVPEPATLSALAAGSVLLIARRRRA